MCMQSCNNLSPYEISFLSDNKLSQWFKAAWCDFLSNFLCVLNVSFAYYVYNDRH